MQTRCRWMGGVLLGLLLLTALPAAGRPEIKSTALRAVGSLRLQPYRWATLTVIIVNPDPEKTEVRLRLAPQNQRNVTVYDVVLPLPPQTRFRYTAMVAAGRTESYDLQLWHRGALVQTDKDIPVRVGSEATPVLCVINDDIDVSLGDFVRNEDLRETQQVSNLRTEEALSHWAGWDQCDLMLMVRPDFDRMTSLQAEAILTWVARGGTLFVCTPEAIAAAADSPLAPCLPVRPLTIRPTQYVPGFAELGCEPVTWPESITFLESVPEGPGITVLNHEDAPLLRWRRYGLGLVGVVTVDIANHHFQNAADGQCFAAFWNHVLAHGGRLRLASSPTPGQPREALESITGIEIPSRGTIRLLLGAYVVLLVGLIVGGGVTRRWLAAWTTIGVLAIVLTAGVFLYAQSRSSHLPTQTAALVAYHAIGTADASNERIISLYKRREETRLNLTVPRTNHRLRAPAPDIPKPRGGTYQRQQNDADTVAVIDEEAVRDPIRLRYTGDSVGFDNMLLRANAPRIYAQLSRVDTPPPGDLPTVRWTAGGPTIADWPVPPELAATDGALVCPRGAWPVTIVRDRLRLEPGVRSDAWMPDTDLRALVDLLADPESPTPLLALYSRELAGDRTGIPDDFTTIARSLTLLPVLQELTGELNLPPEYLPIETSGAASRLLRVGDQWQPATEQSARTYELAFELPPGLKTLAPTEIAIDFVADNRGNNLEFKLALRTAGGTDVAVAEQRADRWIFTDLPPDLFTPAAGRCTVLVRVEPIRQVGSTSASRLNTWTLRRLDVTVRGHLPAPNQGAF